MSGYDQIAWFPLCGGLTGLGLVLTYLAWRGKRGWRTILRGVAWSALPMAAYLTGAIEMFWKIGAAIGNFATGFVFSPKVWSGIALAGLSGVLFLAAGGIGIRRRRGKRVKGGSSGGGGVPAARSAAGELGAAPTIKTSVPETKPEPVPVARKAKRGKSSGGGDDDMKEIEDILRSRGIN
jgi:hypothetical protein